MFQFPGLALIIWWVTVLQTAGLSHSEIPGSKVICTYPRLIAAYHVLHRLHEPRHPPCALIYFLYKHLCHLPSWYRRWISGNGDRGGVAHTFSCIKWNRFLLPDFRPDPAGWESERACSFYFYDFHFLQQKPEYTGWYVLPSTLLLFPAPIKPAEPVINTLISLQDPRQSVQFCLNDVSFLI